MKELPRLDRRRARDFAAELLSRARSWLPHWKLAPDSQDPGRALLEVAARLSAEVAERLDQVAEKNRRNLVGWLGMRGAAARGARLPAAFKLTDSAHRSVLAQAPVQMQADAGGKTVVFESEHDVLLVPARVAQVVAIDAAADAYYLPPPGLASLDPLPLLPTQWRVRSFAASGSNQLQLEPALGLEPGMILGIAGLQFRVTKVSDGKDIVTLDPAIDIPDGIAQDAPAIKVAAFEPYDGAARNRQNHALYLGHADLLNIESTAAIEVVNGESLASGVAWQYWGKVGESDAAWNPLFVAADDRQQRDALVLDKSTVGAIEPREVGGVKSRWIRAVVPTLSGSTAPLVFGDLKLRVGSGDAAAQPKCEGLVNTTPLVLDSTFLPLGREPRQFDAFYLGCGEVFSKKNATVTLDFKLADTSFRSLTNVGPARLADALLAGVARDGSLHLLAFETTTATLGASLGREALQPTDASAAGGRVALDTELRWRLPVWSGSSYFAVPASTGAHVWIYYESKSSPYFGFWASLDSVVTTPQSGMKLDGLVHLSGAAFERLYALYDGELLQRSLSGASSWLPVPTLDGIATVTLQAIAGIDLAPGVAAPGPASIVGVSDAEVLYEVDENGTCNELPTAQAIAPTVQPVAVRFASGDVLVFAASAALDRLVAHHSVTGDDDIQLGASETVVGLALDHDLTTQTVIATVSDGSASRLVWWTPFAGSTTGELLDAPLDPSIGVLAGEPTRLPDHAIVPGSSSDVLVLPIRSGGVASGNAPLEHWAVQPTTATALTSGDLINARAGHGGLARVIVSPITVNDARYFPLATETADPSYPPDLLAFRHSQPGVASTFDSSTATESLLLLAVADALDGVDVVAINDAGSLQLYAVDSLAPGAGPAGETVATIRPQLTSPVAGDPVEVWPAIDFDGAIVPVLRLDSAGTPVNVAAATANIAAIVFPGATPARQRGTVVTRGLGDVAAAVALDSLFSAAPPVVAGEVAFTINGAPGAWLRRLGDSSSNPELSWEYSDGKSWRLLPGLIDRTRHLKASDTVVFDVPDDLVESDWAGRTNHWIRARLVGGDYGKEVFKVASTTSGSTTTQSVERSTTGIKPPAVVSMHVTYGIETAVHPAGVLAEDAGGFRNQTDANRTPGAAVEAFVPMSVTLGRLDGSIAASGADATGDERCERPCCISGSTAGTSAAATKAASAAIGRALLIGIDGEVQGEPVNLLFMVAAERPHDDAAPLRVEALVAGRFDPVVAVDGTRALGESGIVSLSLPQAPTTSELFGRKLAWLRLTPDDATTWKPSVAGVVLNAAWASAAETQTLEVLGSSAGEPNMVLTIARPPLLRDSLELRVRESLSDEEVEELRRTDATRVRSNVANLPGHWVRWEPVVDPADSAPGERVYALDEAAGTVRFGDGLHGMIPPIGRDHIVAFRYQRTEPIADDGSAALVTARTALGLVTPLEGVESVVAAADAGRGAPPDDPDRVLRFAPAQLRHRERALSAHDVEDIVLQAQPAVAQACCLLQDVAVRLIVVMRGPVPTPSRAMVRELSGLLAGALPPTLSGRRAPRIEGPVLRPFRLRATLRVPTLETAGQVANRARDELRTYFDPARGSDEGQGWPLGRAPNATEIAARLIDLPGLDGIAVLEIVELADGIERPWIRALRSNELALLADDGFEFTYELAEAVA